MASTRLRMWDLHYAQVMACCTSCMLRHPAITVAWSWTHSCRSTFIVTARTAGSWWRGLLASRFPFRGVLRATSPSRPEPDLHRRRVLRASQSHLNLGSPVEHRLHWR